MRSTFIGVFLIGAALAACSKPEPPRVTPRAVRAGAVSPAGIRLAVELDVYNPNSFPIVAQAVAGTLELGSGVELGRGRVAAQTAIAAKSSSLVNSELAVTWTNVAALAPLALSTAPVP
jgi:LEA14-like dessication related protein